MLHRFIPYRYRMPWLNARHDAVCRPVLDTPPIRAADDGVVLFSMMGTKVLLPYLVAVKSLWSNLHRGRVMILDDGTLTAEDKKLLAYHCDNPEIRSIHDVDVGEFPVGGTWERLLTILDCRANDYMIQLDSDTVTIGDADAVRAAIDANRSFTLLGGIDADIGALTCAEFSPRLYPDGINGSHIQTRMEADMDKLPLAATWRYIRGCSGFTGFARGGNGRALADAFAKAWEERLGREAMHIWGTEQVTSSFLIANEPDPLLLPPARYLNFWGDGWGQDARFIHFVGAHRYTGSAYADMTRHAIAAMRTAKAA